MFCPKCGAQNPDGAAFCGDCGASLVANKPATTTSVTISTPTSVATLGQSLAADGSMAAAAHNTGRKLVIAVAAVIVVAIATICIYFFACSVKPVYVPATRVVYVSGVTTPLVTLNYAYAEDGTLLTVTTKYSYDGSSTTEPPIPYTYEYYRPGIIKSVEWEQEISGIGKQRWIQTFNEDGWMVHQSIYYNGELTPDNDISFEYKFADDGKSVMQISTDSYGYISKDRIVFDENGNPVERYDINDKGEETLSQTTTYQKIDHPTQDAAATARLKG